MFLCIFFCKQKTAYEMRISDWSSDVCSSDLLQGSFSVKEWFGEIAAPLIDADAIKLDLNGAARYSDYSNSGGIWSWKLGGTARLFDDLLLRVTRSRDIRSPGVGELFSVRSAGVGPLEIGRAQVCTPVTNAPIVCRHPLEKKYKSN